jgi:hypothetical protein
LRSAAAIVYLVSLAAVFVPTVAGARSGSGTASITPSADVTVGATGTWTITYTAAETFSTGTLEVVIPNGWTPPQDGNSFTAGFVRVTINGSETDGFSVAGRTITVSVDTLSVGEEIAVVYGDDEGGAKPTARVAAARVTQTAEFIVRSDPSGNTPVPIVAGTPSLTVVAGPPARLVIEPFNNTVEAGAWTQYTVTVVDIDGNRQAVSQTRTLRLLTPSGSFYRPSDHSTPINTDTLPAGEDSLVLDLRGERAVSGLIFIATIDTLNPGLTGIANLTVDPGEVASFEWTVITDDTLAGEPAEAVLTATDSVGNIVTDFVGNVELSTTSPELADSVVEWFASPLAHGDIDNAPGGDRAIYGFDDQDGGSVHLLVRDFKAETIQLWAQEGTPMEAISPTSIVFSHNIADFIAIVAGDSQTATVDNPVSVPPTVRVVDQYGNPVDEQTVTFTITEGGGTVDVTAGGGRENTGQTDQDGQLECDVWTLGTQAGGNVLRASIATGSQNFVNITATGTPDVGTRIQMDPASRSVTVNSIETVITATLFDQYDNSVPDEVVNVFVHRNDQGELLNDSARPTTRVSPWHRWARTDASGQVSVKYAAPEIAGLVDSVDAYTELVSPDSVPDAVLTTTVDGATDLRITFNGSDTTRAGSSFSFRIEAVDGNGNIDTDTTVVVRLVGEDDSQIGFSESASGPWDLMQVTLEDGVRDNLYGRGDSVGIWEIKVEDQGETPLESDSTDVIVLDADLVDHYEVMTAVSSVTAGQPFNLTIEAWDQFDNRVMGADGTVQLRAVDASTLVEEQVQLLLTQATLENGWAELYETYELAKDIKIRAWDGENKQGYSRVLTVTPAAAAVLTANWADSAGVEAGTVMDVGATVLDPHGNPVAGEVVNFTVTQGTGELTSTSDTSDVDGSVSVAFRTGSIVGSNGVKATIITTAGVERVDYFVYTVAGSITSLEITFSQASMTAGETIGVDIFAVDQYDNVVEQDDSTVVNISVPFGDAVPGDTTKPLTDGQLSTTVTSTLAGEFQLRVEAVAEGDTVYVISPAVTVKAGDPYEIVGITADPTPVAAGESKELRVRVSDQYGNATSNVPVRFSLIPRGGLDGTAYMLNGFGWTNAEGQAIDTLRTADLSGVNNVEAEISEGDDPWETATLTVITIPGSIDHYEVLTDTTVQTVGQPVWVEVRAVDKYNNLVAGDDTTEVELSLSPVTGWGPVIDTLQGGTLLVQVINTVAGDITFHAESVGDSSISGLSDIVTFTPDVPSSVWPIMVNAQPDSITATGLSEAEVTAGGFKDQFGNLVSAGTMATVRISPGKIITPDQDPADGNQQPIDIDGSVTFSIRSDTTAVDAEITVRSGEAEGTGVVHFAQRPVFVCPEAPEPSSVIVGQTYGFRVFVQNTSSTGVDLSDATVFRFTDGPRTFEANLTVERPIAAGDTATLEFESELIDMQMIPGAYPSWVILNGIDQFGSPFSYTSFLPGGSLLVSAIQITGITPPPARSIGQSDTVRVQVTNPSPKEATITAVDLTFSPTGDFPQGTSPDIGKVIAGGGTTGTIRVPVTIGSGTVPGMREIDASVTAQVDGNTVIDPSVAPADKPKWAVLSAVALSYVDDSLAPKRVSQGQTRIFSVEIHNSGGAPANLYANESTLSFTDGTSTVSTPLSQGKAIAPNSSETLEFQPLEVPDTLAEDTNYDVTLYLSGDENNVPFSDTLRTAPLDYLVVETPAAVAEAPDALEPDRHYRGSQLTMKVNVVNTGSASVVLEPESTTVAFSSFKTTLDPSETTTIKPGPNTLTFQGMILEETVDTIAYHPTVRLQGWENGVDFVDDITIRSDSIVVEEAPAISIVSIETSQDTITVGRAYEIDVWMIVQNNGGAAVEYSSSAIAFELGNEDLTGEYFITPPGFNNGTELQGNGASDTLTFQVQTSPSETAGKLTITGELEVLDSYTQQPIYAATDGGGKGSLLVQEQAILSIESMEPNMDPVTSDMVVPFEIEMVVRNTGGSNVRLLLEDANTNLSFETSGWEWSVRDVLSNGDSVLAEGEAGIVVFDVSRVSAETGNTKIGGEISGIELNSDFAVTGTTGGPILGEIVVQDSAKIVVSNVEPSRTTLTNGSNVPWEISLDVTNGGGAAVDLDLPLGFTMSFEDTIVEPDWTPPPAFEGGGIQLPPGQTRRLVVDVSNMGQFAIGTSLDKSINIEVRGQEQSTGILRSGSGMATVTVQVPPTIVYTDGDLHPGVVSHGQSVEFKLPLLNPDPNAATIELNRDETKLEFAGGFFQAFLKPSSPDRIPGAPELTTLVFHSREITTNIPTGAQNDVTATMVWNENGSADSTTTINIPSSDLIVQEQPDLNIVSIEPSSSTVTVGQDFWTIRMVLDNRLGAADVGLDLSEGATRLSLKNLDTGNDVSSEYTITPPESLVAAGDTVLTGGTEDELIFTVYSTGTTTGTIVVSGTVVGTDLNSEEPVEVSSTGGSFILQSAAVLQIESIEPTQQTATVNQDGVYAIKMAVRNTGGSAVDVTLDTANTKLHFIGSSGWDFDINNTLSGGGTQIAGGQVDTVTFNVIRSGDTAGETTIGGTVAATVVNTGDTVTVDSTNPGWSISLQSEAQIVIDGVTTSRDHVTAGSGSAVPWDIVIAVRNDGESRARLELPSSLGVSVSGGAISYDPVFEIDGGGVILEGDSSRTLTIHVNSTGSFTEWGDRDISVDFDAVEINSDRNFSPSTGVGSITVDKAPVLTVLDLTPNTVSSGANVGFTVRVANQDPLAATAVLDRAGTRLHFDDNHYSAFLDLANNSLAIGPAQEVLIRFDTKLIGGSIAADTFDVNVDLTYGHNGNAATARILLVDSVVVESAPVLSITKIIPNREEVTAGQSGPLAVWTITMEVHNGGAAALDLNLDSTSTDIWFELLPDRNRDTTYTLLRPDTLSNGGTTLFGNRSGKLLYTVLKTGDSTGVVEINGRVVGIDPSTEDDLIDDTGDGGSEIVTVQSPALLQITKIENPPRVTEEQGGWFIRMTAQNDGESDVNLVLENCRLSFGADSTNWVVKDPVLEGGGTELEGRTSRVLLFEVETAGSAGDWRIDGYVEGEEINSKTTKQDSTDTTGYGSIEVQVPPRVRLEVTELDAPRPPWVNTGQKFYVKAEVANLDDAPTADAKNVRLQISGTGDSYIDTTSFTIESVPSGSTASYSFPVTAGAPGTTDTFTVEISGAEDANSGLPVDPLPPDDNLAFAHIQTPADLEIVSVTPDRDEVTRQQTTPWYIDVVVRNNGSAPMELVEPAEDDIKFYLGDEDAIGYTVEPPDSFLWREPGDWFVDSLVVDTLRYNVSVTGIATGTVTIEATLNAKDLNTLTADTTAVGTGIVHVQEVSGLYIASTVTDSTFNDPTPKISIVNTEQVYKILVTLKNTDTGEAVDSVRVELTSDGNSVVEKKGEEYRFITSGENSIYVFEVTADTLANPLEEFTAAIQYAVSANSGKKISPSPAVDDNQIITTQTAANLTISDLWISAPSTVTGDKVSTKQEIYVAARLENTGQGDVKEKCDVILAAPGFTFEDQDSVKAFELDDEKLLDITWRLTAPDSVMTSQFTVAITGLPTDLNDGEPADTTDASRQIMVSVVEASLVSDTLYVSSPAGAQDDTVSTDQTFIVKTRLSATEAVGQVEAAIELPSGFQTLGASTVDFGNGPFESQEGSFQVQAPANPTTGGITIRFSGIDVNTDSLVTVISDTLRIAVVEKARLALSVDVSPGKNVAINSSFTLEAVVRNHGQAAITTDQPGTVTIDSIPDGYSLDEGYSQSQSFSLGKPVIWEVRAPRVRSGPDDFVIRVDDKPHDENTGGEAVVDTFERSISIFTEGATIEIAEDQTVISNSNRKVVQGGAVSVDKYAFSLTYNVPDGDHSANSVKVCSVTVAVREIVGEDTRTLSDKALHSVLDSVYVRSLDGRRSAWGTPDPGSSRYVVNTSDWSAARITPAGSITLIVGVDVARGAEEKQLKFLLEGEGSIMVRDSVTNYLISVVNATGDPINNIWSSPLVVLSSEFEEYVHNYPNPFRARDEATKITYFLDSPGDVSIKIYDLLGNLVYDFENDEVPTTAGTHEVEWQGYNKKGEVVRNGVYVCVLSAGGQTAKFRIAVAK